MTDLPAERQEPGDSAADNPFAELNALYARVDPEMPYPSFRLLQCKTCGVSSGWADVWSPGGKGLDALNNFQAGHRNATQGSGPFGSVGHRNFHQFDVERRTV